MRKSPLLAVFALVWSTGCPAAEPAPAIVPTVLPFAVVKDPPAGVTQPVHAFDGRRSLAGTMRVYHGHCPPNWALVELTVGTDGSVSDLTLLQSSGDDDLDTTFKQDLSTWHFTPATKDGAPVAARWRDVLALSKPGAHFCPNLGPLTSVLPALIGASPGW
jgi:TonB family protein